MKLGDVEPKTGIYQIKNIKNGKKYIGCAEDTRQRLKHHLSDLRNDNHHSAHFQNSWNKYGGDCFEIEILEECDREELQEVEQEYINEFLKENNRVDHSRCYNMSPEATHTPMSREAIERMRKSKGGFDKKKRRGVAEKYKEGDSLRKLTREYSVSRPTVKKYVLEFYDSLRTHSEATGGLSEKEIKEAADVYRNNTITLKELCEKFSVSRGTMREYLNSEGVDIKHGSKRREITFSEEHKEKIRKGRSKLNWEIVREIRERYEKENISYKDLSKDYNCSTSNISAIINQETWRE